MSIPSSTPDLKITAPVSEAQSAILTPEALKFLSRLTTEFEPRRQELLALRRMRQAEIDARHFPVFCPKRRRSARGIGPSRPFRKISSTGGLKSPARWIARW